MPEGGRRKSLEKGPNAVLVGQLLPEQSYWGSSRSCGRSLCQGLCRRPIRRTWWTCDDEDKRLKAFSFPQEAVLQQAFRDFQMQQMTSAFEEHFGFNDEEFGEQEEKTPYLTRRPVSASPSVPMTRALIPACLSSAARSGSASLTRMTRKAWTRKTLMGRTPSGRTDGGARPTVYRPRKQILSDPVPVSASVDLSLGTSGLPDPPRGRVSQDSDNPLDRAKALRTPTAAEAPQESTEASALACHRQAARRATAAISKMRDLPRPSCQDGDLPVLPSAPAPGGSPPFPNTK